FDHAVDRHGAVFVPAYSLRPQAEGAARFAAATGIPAHIGVLEIAAEIVLDLELPVDWEHGRELVHVHQDLALGIVENLAVRSAIGETLDGRPVGAFGKLLDGELVFVAADKIDRRRRFQAFLRLNSDLGADEADL